MAFCTHCYTFVYLGYNWIYPFGGPRMSISVTSDARSTEHRHLPKQRDERPKCLLLFLAFAHHSSHGLVASLVLWNILEACVYLESSTRYFLIVSRLLRACMPQRANSLLNSNWGYRKVFGVQCQDMAILENSQLDLGITGKTYMKPTWRVLNIADYRFH